MLAVQPDDPSALWCLSFALIANSQSEEAIPVLEKTVSIMDRSPGALKLMAIAYAQSEHGLGLFACLTN